MSDEKVVVSAVEQVENKGAPDEIVLSSGVILGLKKSVNPLVFLDLINALDKEKPKPPITYIKTLDIWEKNPDHPDYIGDVKIWEDGYTKKVSDALILLGTFVKYVPDSVQTMDDDEWIEDLDVIGIEVGKRKKERYLAWVKGVAIQSAKDYATVQDRVSAIAGVSEKEVAEATNSFPSDNRRR